MIATRLSLWSPQRRNSSARVHRGLRCSRPAAPAPTQPGRHARLLGETLWTEMAWASSSSSSSAQELQAQLINIIQLSPDSSSLVSSYPITTSSSSSSSIGHPTQLKSFDQRLSLISAFSSQPILLAWDLRSPDFKSRPTIELRGTYESSAFICLDHSPDANLIVAASTQADDSTLSQIELFDLRATTDRPICIYDQAHSDSITNLEFEPGSNHSLLSASSDGLLVLHDIRLSDQDESILSVANVGASIAHVRWRSDRTSIWSGTDMETLSSWNPVDHLSLIEDYGDLRQNEFIQPGPSWDHHPIAYLIDLFNPGHSSYQSGFFVGSSSGNVLAVDTSEPAQEDWKIIGSLQGGHQEMVRCATLNQKYGLILTGGEDGRICVWSNRDDEIMDSSLGPNLESIVSLSPSITSTDSVTHSKSREDLSISTSGSIHKRSKTSRFQPY